MTIEPEDLESLVHRALAQLPEPRAPHTLRGRVMGAIPATGKRPWFTWSSPVQAAAGVAGVVVAVALAWMWPVVVATLAAWAPAPVQTGVGYLTGAAETSAALGRVAELTWVAVVAPLARGLLLVTVVLCGAAALCVAALNRVALGGASRS